MDDFVFQAPTEFVFGRGAEQRVGEHLKALGVRKALIHHGRGSAAASGLLAVVEASLSEAGIASVELGGVRPNPEVGLVREGIALAREEQVDFILAVGGGSVIDSAKGIAMGVRWEGDVWDIYARPGRGVVPLPNGVVPLGCVLTIPAAGSEGSSSAVLSNDGLGLKSGMSSPLVRPRISFMDPELTFTLPAEQTAAGCCDMFCHLMERYFSASAPTPVTDNLNLSLMRTIRGFAPRVLEDPEDYEARANLMWAGMLAHNGIAGCGRDEDWASHALEHELSAVDPHVAHGAGLAVIFPAWMRFVYRQNPRRFVEMGREVFGIAPTGDEGSDARRAIEAVQMFFISLDLPSRLSDLGFDEDDVEKMIPTLIQNKGDRFGSFRVLGADEARAIYRLAL